MPNLAEIRRRADLADPACFLSDGPFAALQHGVA